VWNPYIQLRAGYFYENGAVPTKTMTVATFDANKHAMTFGISGQYWKFRFDFTYVFILYNTVIVTDSIKRQVNPLYEEDALKGEYKQGEPTMVGNGRYAMAMHIIAFTLSFLYE
jgi:long-subunit fatty acid transport protein